MFRRGHLNHAVRLAIKGLHFRKFTEQTLAAHEFREAALAGYQQVEELAEVAATSPLGLLANLERHADEARRRVRRLHRRLRPEFRRNLLPDRARVEAAIEACVREVSGLELLRRWAPHVETWFAKSALSSALASEGYQPAARDWRAQPEPTVTLAPVVRHGRLRRSLELFFRELGVKVVTTTELLAQLGNDKLERLQQAGSAAERLCAYLRELGHRIDAVVVPSTDEVGDVERRIEVLAAAPNDGASTLPQLVCVRIEHSRRRLRESLVELGVALTGDRDRAEAAFDHVFALG
jgi:hypothetical protein